MAVAELLTWAIPPMPLYDEFYKTADHEGAIFLHASMSSNGHLFRDSLAWSASFQDSSPLSKRHG
jgi:hypothetical protein